MNKTTRSAVTAAALATAGLAVAVGAASGASAATAPRIVNHEQLRAGIAAAVAGESANPVIVHGMGAGIPLAG